MDKSRLNDEQLWTSVMSNDADSFNIIFEKYWEVLYKTAYFYLKDKHSCEEVVNDIFLNLWNKRSSLEIISLKNYLKACARYHIYKKLKKIKHSKVQYVEDYEKVSPLTVLNQGDLHLKEMELKNQLLDVIEPLPRRCRQIFVLSRLNCMSNDEIARLLGISKRSVENQLTHALKHLRLAGKK